MQAKITHPNGYTCAPDGHTAETFAQGQVVRGQVAAWAVAAGAAEEIREKQALANKAEQPQSTKRRRK